MVGTIIGSGIFVVPNLVARSLPSEPWILAAWVFTGVLSFFGALAYAELGAMMPATGGQYVFLREAYGPLCGFLCGWTYFFIIISAAIAWLSITFATYVAYFVPLTPLASKAIAVALDRRRDADELSRRSRRCGGTEDVHPDEGPGAGGPGGGGIPRRAAPSGARRLPPRPAP